MSRPPAQNGRLWVATHGSVMLQPVPPDVVSSILAEALNLDDFPLLYQPWVRLEDHKTVCVEALSRLWCSGELLAPGHFIPLAVENGSIRAITESVLRRAPIEVSRARPELTASVNVSALDLCDRGWLERTLTSLSNRPAGHAIWELTETETAAPNEVHAAIDLIRSYGIEVALDDFGTGTATLGQLAAVELDYLKIDGSLIDGLNQRRFQVVIRSVINLAHELDMQVIAEKVETAEQAMILGDLGCDYGQGFLFGRPTLAAELAVT